MSDDVEPRALLFRGMKGGTSKIVATEALIRRVERAGCTGRTFLDLALTMKHRGPREG